MTGTLETRAAKYFGVHYEPRTTVKVGRWSCFIVLPRRKALAYYDEQRTRIRGDYVTLTDEQREALAQALA